MTEEKNKEDSKAKKYEKKRRRHVFGWFWNAPWRTAALAALLFHVLLVILFALIVVLSPPGRGKLFRIGFRRPDLSGDDAGARRGGDNKRQPTEMEKFEERVRVSDPDHTPSELVTNNIMENSVRVRRPEAITAGIATESSSIKLTPAKTTHSGGPVRGPGKSLYDWRWDRGRMAGRNGGTPGSESAVEKGLKFLARHQAPDGSWDSPGYGKIPGITGLCMLAFLGAGYDIGGNYGEVIHQSADFLIDNGKDGYFGGKMYSHSIVTLALAEAASVGGYRRGRSAARVGVNTIIEAQKITKTSGHRGGWRYYRTSTDSDLSVTGWAIMALIGGRHAGARVPRYVLGDAARYVKGRANNGTFGYTGIGGGSSAMTASGALSMQLCGYPYDPSVDAALKTLKERMPSSGQPPDYYYLYYATQAMFQKNDKEHWGSWNNSCRDYLVGLQMADGGWPGGAGPGEEAAGRYYSTAMAVLSLEVYYRYRPLFEVEGAIGGML